MALVLVTLFLMYSSLQTEVLSSLVTCPVGNASSIRYTITLSSSMLGSYSGTLLLSSNGNFIALFNVPETGSPQSAVQGTWSLSDCTNILTFNTNTHYFLDLPKMTIDSFSCTYTCGTNDIALRRCSVTYTLKRLQASGSYSLTLDLSNPE